MNEHQAPHSAVERWASPKTLHELCHQRGRQEIGEDASRAQHSKTELIDFESPSPAVSWCWTCMSYPSIFCRGRQARLCSPDASAGKFSRSASWGNTTGTWCRLALTQRLALPIGGFSGSGVITTMAKLSAEKQRRSTVLDEDINMVTGSPKRQMCWLSYLSDELAS